MGNMAYCRFENTANDLSDCYDVFDDHDLSYRETIARKRIIKMAVDIALDWGYEVDRHIIEEG